MNVQAEWGQSDLHIHTTHSDGSATVDSVLSYAARRAQLCAIAITDHDTIAGALLAARMAPAFGLTVIVGEEVSTTCGHLIGLFLDRHIPAGLSPQETVRRIHEQGGLAIAPHPFDASVASLGCRMSAQALRALPLDGIEVFNAGIFGPWRAANAAAQRLADEMGLAQLGGSDAHALCAVGSGRTRFQGRSAADIFTAITSRSVVVEGEYLTRRAHIRQIVDMLRQLGLRSFTRALRSGVAAHARPVAQPAQG